MTNALFNTQTSSLDYLKQRIANIDIWLDDNKEFYLPTVIDTPKAIEYRRKAFGEFCLYAYVAEQYDSFTRPAKLTQLFFTEVNSDAFLALAKRNTTTYGYYTFPIAVAKKMGKCRPELLSYFEEIFASSHLRSMEIPPFRLLDNLFTSHVYGLKTTPYDTEEVYKLINLHRLPDPIMADYTQAYALTHNVFYLTGLAPNKDVLGLNPDYDLQHLQALEALFLRFLADNNLDLALELLLCLVLTNQCKRWHVQYALEQVEKHLINNVVVPGPGEPDGFSQLQDQSANFKHWVKHYHTMMVAGITFRLVADNLNSIWQKQDTGDTFVAFGCGQLLRLLHDYNLPLALTVLKTLENYSADIKSLQLNYLVDHVMHFIEQQIQDNGEIGYYYNEIYALTNKGISWEEASKNIQMPLRKVHDSLNWNGLRMMADKKPELSSLCSEL